MKEFIIQPTVSSIDELIEAVHLRQKAILSNSAKDKIKKGREYLDKKLNSSNLPLYGVNTGFGALYNKKISKKDLKLEAAQKARALLMISPAPVGKLVESTDRRDSEKLVSSLSDRFLSGYTMPEAVRNKLLAASG